MRNSGKTILRLVLPITLILMAGHVLAQEQPKGDQTQEAKQEVSEPEPDLADIIPKATKLSGDLAILENRVAGILDISKFEEKYARMEENLKDPAAGLQQIKDSQAVKLDKLIEIRKVIERKNKLIEEISSPLNETIRQFGTWRNDWQTEKQQWHKWE